VNQSLSDNAGETTFHCASGMALRARVSRTHDLRKRDGLLPKLDLPSRDAGDVEKVVDETYQVLGLPLDRLSLFRHDAFVPYSHQLRRGHDGGEGVAQLVSQDREELVLSSVRLAQVVFLPPVFEGIGCLPRHNFQRSQPVGIGQSVPPPGWPRSAFLRRSLTFQQLI
jgi:hypothetical protein